MSHCNDLLSKIEVESSINRTINEVERLIRQNSSIPHLSRREIVDILVNITSKDLETYKDKEKIEEARKIYQRALMVVLPYNAENSEESIKDLYTKPPIVEIITDPLHNQENYEAWKSEKLQLNKPTLHDKESIENLVVTHTSERTMSEENSPEKVRYKNHKETYSEMNMNVRENIKFDSAPVKFSFNLENLGKPTTTKEPITTTKHPVFIKSTEDEDVDIIYSTSITTEQPMRTSPKSASINSKESQTLFRPLKQNENVLSANQWRYHAPTSVPQSPVTSAKIPSSFKTAYKQSFSSISTLLPEDISAPTEINKIEDTSEREISKIISDEILMEDVEETTPIYVTPMSSSSSPFFSSKKSNYNSTYNLNLGGFRKITTTTTTMRPEVMELIASIGLRPENTMHIEKVFERNKESFQNKSQVLDSNGLLYTTTSGLTAGKPDSQSIAGQNTFEGSVSELGQGMNNLTPDIRVLFQRFGLQTSNLVTSTPKPTTSGPTVNTNSYTNFKILPTFSVKDQEMKEFLAKFGLGVSDNRHKKAMPASTECPSLIEAVPDNMKSILENLGLISRKTVPKVQSVEPIKVSKFHVFKPHEVKIKDEKQKMQINELLDTIRLVQKGKASANDVRKAASDLLTTTKTLKNGPDPLSLEEIIAIYNSDVKNEVKRQQDSPKTVETVTNSNQDLTNNTTAPTGKEIRNIYFTLLGSTS